jgi:Leucine-rich repeat (LRR) protein
MITMNAVLTAYVAVIGACGASESRGGPSTQHERTRNRLSYIKPDWDPPARSPVFDPLVWHGEPDPKTTTTLEAYHIEAGVGLKWIADFHALEKLNLSISNIFDADIEHLSSLNHLADLSLNRLCITESGLLHLTGIPSLETLDISAMNQCRLGWPPGVSVGGFGRPPDVCDRPECRGISGPGLDVLGELPNLKSLTLSGSIATDANMAHLSELGAIQELRIYNAPLTDAGLRHLYNLDSVESLEIRAGRITGSAYADLAIHLGVKHLAVASSHVDPKRIPRASGLKSLESLTIKAADLSDAVLRDIDSLSQLTTLDLTSCTMDFNGLSRLQGLQRLESLILASVNRNGRQFSLDPLSHLARLRNLDLSNTRVYDLDIRALRDLPHLTRLDLSGTLITDGGLVHLSGLTELEELLLDRVQITDAGLAHLKPLTNLKRLKINRYRFSDEAIADLQQTLPGQAIE